MPYEIAKTSDTLHARVLEETPDKHIHPIPYIVSGDSERKHPGIDSRRRTRHAHDRTDEESRETSECKSNYVVYPWHPS